jgi:sugar/nucleoside kinase (ribokinase family)
MPRLLAVGHVTWDRLKGGEVLGGSVSYAALAARKLGWEAAVLTSAGPDFEPARDLPGIDVFVRSASATTRFENVYDEDGTRHQMVRARADEIDLAPLPEGWRRPDVLLLCPVVGELHGPLANAFEAEVVGATAQGWLRAQDADGTVFAREWRSPGADLAGVHALVYSEQDIDRPDERARAFLEHVPMVLVTRGYRGLSLVTRSGVQEIPAWPRPEVDPTGAGDVFTTGFLLHYQETGDPAEAAAYGSCAASCVVEGLGVSRLGDRAEIERRLQERERYLESGDWEEPS